MNLFDHQKAAMERVDGFQNVAFYHDMGLGKTFTGAAQMVKFGCPLNLVICQKSKVQDWVDHLEKFYGYPGNLETGCNPYHVIDLTKWKANDFKNEDKFVTELIAGQIIYVINYELAWRRPELKQLKNFCLMLDESSLIQNRKAKQSKFILSLTPAHVVLLSGTPVSGKYENLWTQLHLLGWPISEDLYNRQYVNWIWVEHDGYFRQMVDPDTPYKNVDRLRGRLREYGADFLETEECFTLPEQTTIPLYVPTSPQYRSFMREKYVLLPDGTELIGDQVFKHHLYARQLCGIYSKAKIDAFRELLQSTNDRLIVFYNFTAELEELEAVCHDLERPFSLVTGACKRLDEYENYEDSVTLIQYQAGAMGLNLQKANKIVYFTLPERSDLFEQSKKRTHRIGQQRPCFYWVMMCRGSIEEKIYSTLLERKDYTDALFEKAF